jgi:hypothetical protein
MGYTPTTEDVISAQTASAKERFNKAGYDYDK